MKFQTYLESWNADLSDVIIGQDINENTPIILVYASFNFNSQGTIQGVSLTKEQIVAIISQVKQKGGKILVSFGGMDSLYYLSKSNLWSDVASIATAIVNIINNYGFDGCDLDIEEEQSSNSFASKVTELIQTIRTLSPLTIINLTIPAQGWNQYWQTLAIKTMNLVDNIKFKEYNLWINNNYVDQIKSDINDYYINSWHINANKISLCLMPGIDNMGRSMSIDMVSDLLSWSKTKGLNSVCVWTANRDFEGLIGLPPFAFSNYILNNM